MGTIVLTTDLSVESKRAFAPTAALARKLGHEVVLLAVLEEVPFEPSAGGMIAPMPDRGAIRSEWEKQVAKFAKDVGEPCKRAVVLDAFDVPRAIVDFAAKEKAEFLAIASHGRSGLRRLLLGSVTEVVLRHAHVPVLVFPPQA